MKNYTIFGILLILTLTLTFPSFQERLETTSNPQKSVEEKITPPEFLAIEGLVENPINVTYNSLLNLPLISETTTLECIGSGQGGPKITFNWTGVPLFYLLNMAKVISGGYREVVFNASDGFSSSVSLSVAMDPTSILALKANGTDLNELSGFGSGYRVVLPCRWGYKWVKWVKQIVIVDYDYKGTYERYGLSDEAIRPNCTMPYTNPPFLAFNITNDGRYAIEVLSNASVVDFSFKQNSQLVFKFEGSENSTEYFYIMFPNDLLLEPYQVYVNNYEVAFNQINYGSDIYLYFICNQKMGTVTITEANAGFGGGGSRKPLLE